MAHAWSRVACNSRCFSCHGWTKGAGGIEPCRVKGNLIMPLLCMFLRDLVWPPSWLFIISLHAWKTRQSDWKAALCTWKWTPFLTLHLFLCSFLLSAPCLKHLNGDIWWCNVGRKSFWVLPVVERRPVLDALGTNLSSTLYVLCGFKQGTYTLSAFFCKIRRMKIPHKAIQRIKWDIYIKQLAQCLVYNKGYGTISSYY